MGGIEEAFLAMPAFQGWNEWPGLPAGRSWLAGWMIRQAPPSNVNGLPGDGRKVVSLYQSFLSAALDELQRAAVSHELME